MDGKIAFEEHWALDSTLGSLGQLAETGEPWRELMRRLLDFQDLRLAGMDANGIELAILSLNTPAVQAITDVNRAIELARRANDRLAAEIACRPDRFAGLAALPMQDAEAAIAELTRSVRELGFKGALVNGFSQKDVPDSAVFYDQPEYRPFWAAVQELDVPFYLHPRVTIAERAQAYDGHPWLLGPMWDYAAQTSLHALRLICSGLFDEFPRLRIILGHLGEGIPYDLWRIDHLAEALTQKFPARKPIGDYFRANFHLTTSGHFNDATFQCAVAEMGADRILFSVDYPFETNQDAASWFDKADLSQAARLAIGRTNAIRLFGLDLA
jgi:2,3-dihydroxybenzoate decarboxylase